MRKEILLVIMCLMFNQFCFSQEDVQINHGDTLYFAPIETENYTYIDYYKKTRFEKPQMDLDSSYSWNYYNLFFGTGDFDVTRMPKKLEGQYGIIKHFMQVTDKEGIERNVVVVMIENGVSAAYVLEDAFINEEVLYAQRK